MMVYVNELLVDCEVYYQLCDFKKFFFFQKSQERYHNKNKLQVGATSKLGINL